MVPYNGRVVVRSRGEDPHRVVGEAADLGGVAGEASTRGPRASHIVHQDHAVPSSGGEAMRVGGMPSDAVDPIDVPPQLGDNRARARCHVIDANGREPEPSLRDHQLGATRVPTTARYVTLSPSRDRASSSRQATHVVDLPRVAVVHEALLAKTDSDEIFGAPSEVAAVEEREGGRVP